MFFYKRTCSWIPLRKKKKKKRILQITLFLGTAPAYCSKFLFSYVLPVLHQEKPCFLSLYRTSVLFLFAYLLAERKHKFTCSVWATTVAENQEVSFYNEKQNAEWCLNHF